MITGANLSLDDLVTLVQHQLSSHKSCQEKKESFFQPNEKCESVGFGWVGGNGEHFRGGGDERHYELGDQIQTLLISLF